MLRGIYGDDARYRETYWSKYDGVYFAGDGARIDEDGDFWLLGRVDDVMNVSGHRISTIEVESALVDHHEVAEAAVAARNDATTGQAIVAFVTLKGGVEGSVEKLEELRNHVAQKIGPIAKPANIVFTPELPKTRSGKIMRRLLRDVAENRPLGDTTTLADPTVVGEIRAARPGGGGQGETRASLGALVAALVLAAPAQTATVRVPVANVWEAPDAAICRSTRTSGRPARSRSPQRLALVGHMPTQVLYGERSVCSRGAGGWTKIAVPDQPSPLDARGYPGWVRSWQLGPAFSAPLVVTAKVARLPNGMQVGFGSQVPAGVLPPSATRRLPVSRAGIVQHGGAVPRPPLPVGRPLARGATTARG